MKKIFLFLLLIAITAMVTAQISQIDQLENELNNHTQQDSFRINRLNELATIYYLSRDEREKFADEALSLSNKINYTAGRGNALMLLGSIKFNEDNQDERRLRFMQADSIAKKTGDLELQAKVLWRMADLVSDPKEHEALFLQADSIAKKTGNLTLQATILYQLGFSFFHTDSKKELYYFLQAENLAKKSGNKPLLALIQTLLGFYYQANIIDYAKAMEYSLAGLSSAEEANDAESLIYSCIALSNLYTDLGDQETALSYVLKAEDINKNLRTKLGEDGLLELLGDIYEETGKYPEAIKAFNKSLKLIKDGESSASIESSLAEVYTSMGNLPLAFQYAFSALKKLKDDKLISGGIYATLSQAYLKENMADSAIYYGILGLEVGKKIGTLRLMRDNTLALSNAYAFKKDFQKAYINRLLYINYRDSMLNQEVLKKTAVQQFTFNLDKKQAQITSLNNQKKYQRNLLTGAIVLLFLILVTAILLLRNNRLKQKANKLLEKQKQEIDEKAQNVELLSDIGRKITATLSVEKIIGTVYDNVNSLMDANVFGIGIYNGALKRIDFPATYENGKALPFYSNAVDDENRFSAVCFNNGKEIIINNLNEEYKDHIQEVATSEEGVRPASIIFLQLMAKGEKLGVITVQSFQKNAYSDYQLFMFRNIATYTAIAIENAESYETLNKTLSTLKSTQSQLIQSEKMASLGELTAGIAHEIQNPLNFVNNFSEVNKELLDELKAERLKQGGERDEQTEDEIIKDVIDNSEKINHHGKRADAIVKGMLQHSRSSTGAKEPTNINALADEYLRLSYHGLRAKDKDFNAIMKTDFDNSIGKINIIPQDVGRVLLNLYNNAFYAVNDKMKACQTELVEANQRYEPTVSVTTKKSKDRVIITVSDNGNGIHQNIVDKIFQPFFTTKPTGEGTGLGLSLSYDIIKAHGGEIKVESREGKESEFMVSLPIQ